MAKGDIHTSKQGDRWINKAEGNQCASSSAPTKAEAQADGRKMAIDRGVEHVVHKENGQIGERNTYPRSRDPRESKAPIVSSSSMPCGAQRPVNGSGSQGDG